MDSGTHLVIGLSLAGLACIDPIVAANTAVSTAVFIGVVLGSQAPDTDTLLRLKGNAVYIRNHRGISHSIPALLLWSLAITCLVTMGFQSLSGIQVLHIGLWVTLAVCFHVFIDLFNTYGTQAMRPFSEKWVAWNIIHIFDPVIFATHLLAVFIWSIHLTSPTIIFPVLYAFTALYYAARSYQHYALLQSLPFKDPFYAPGDKYLLIPTIHLTIWHVVKIQPKGQYVLGELKFQTLKWVDAVTCCGHEAVQVSKTHPDIAAFLYFSSYACAELKERTWGYEVRWIDVRYRHRKQYPFVAVLLLDHELKPIDSYVGWLSDSRIEKRLGIDLS